MLYYLVFCLATYLTVLVHIYIPVELVCRRVRGRLGTQNSAFHDFMIFCVRQLVWAPITMVSAPLVFYSLITQDNASIIEKLTKGLLEDE